LYTWLGPCAHNQVTLSPTPTPTLHLAPLPTVQPTPPARLRLPTHQPARPSPTPSHLYPSLPPIYPLSPAPSAPSLPPPPLTNPRLYPLSLCPPSSSTRQPPRAPPPPLPLPTPSPLSSSPYAFPSLPRVSCTLCPGPSVHEVPRLHPREDPVWPPGARVRGKAGTGRACHARHHPEGWPRGPRPVCHGRQDPCGVPHAWPQWRGGVWGGQPLILCHTGQAGVRAVRGLCARVRRAHGGDRRGHQPAPHNHW
jgi:hypothetical protein